MYYNSQSGITLLTKETKPEVVELSKFCDNTATFYVYHQTPVKWDDEIDDNDIDNILDGDNFSCSDEEFNEICKKIKEERQSMDKHEREAMQHSQF